jgi:hypothetical protein
VRLRDIVTSTASVLAWILGGAIIAAAIIYLHRQF